jgi:hypothetical protein
MDQAARFLRWFDDPDKVASFEKWWPYALTMFINAGMHPSKLRRLASANSYIARQTLWRFYYRPKHLDNIASTFELDLANLREFYWACSLLSPDTIDVADLLRVRGLDTYRVSNDVIDFDDYFENLQLDVNLPVLLTRARAAQNWARMAMTIKDQRNVLPGCDNLPTYELTVFKMMGLWLESDLSNELQPLKRDYSQSLFVRNHTETPMVVASVLGKRKTL